MIATITLNPSIDQHITVENLVKDDANRAKEVVSFPGGKGANVSKVVREMGGKTKVYAIVGGLMGAYWEDRLKALDIPYETLEVKGNTRVNCILTDQKDHTQTRVSAPGPFVSHAILKKFIQKLCSVKPCPSYWVLGGSLSTGMKSTTYKEFIHCLQRTAAPCVLDADNNALKEGIKAKPYLIKPNEYEFERLMNCKFKSLTDYRAAARELIEDGIQIVIVSLADKGALFVTRNESFHVSAVKVPVKSKVGAGDSLIGGLMVGLMRKQSLHKAAMFGVACSASAVMREAPRLCSRHDIPGLLKRIEVRKIG